jgi:hypothetical protein
MSRVGSLNNEVIMSEEGLRFGGKTSNQLRSEPGEEHKIV